LLAPTLRENQAILEACSSLNPPCCALVSFNPEA
jgi:hypothetical protein